MRSAKQHAVRHRYCFRGMPGIVAHDDRRPRRMLVHPVCERTNPLGRDMARIEVRHILLSADRVAQAAKDTVTFPRTTAPLVQLAAVNARRHLRPALLGVLLPS